MVKPETTGLPMTIPQSCAQAKLAGSLRNLPRCDQRGSFCGAGAAPEDLPPPHIAGIADEWQHRTYDVFSRSFLGQAHQQ